MIEVVLHSPLAVHSPLYFEILLEEGGEGANHLGVQGSLQFHTLPMMQWGTPGCCTLDGGIAPESSTTSAAVRWLQADSWPHGSALLQWQFLFFQRQAQDVEWLTCQLAVLPAEVKCVRGVCEGGRGCCCGCCGLLVCCDHHHSAQLLCRGRWVSGAGGTSRV